MHWRIISHQQLWNRCNTKHIHLLLQNMHDTLGSSMFRPFTGVLYALFYTASSIPSLIETEKKQQPRMWNCHIHQTNKKIALFFSFASTPWTHLHMVEMLRFVSDINQPSLPNPFYSILVSISVFVTLSTVFHSINSPNNSPFSHSVLILSLIHIWRCRRDVLCRSRWAP